MVAGLVAGGGVRRRRDPAVVGAAPGRGVVYLRGGVDEGGGLGEIFGEDGYGVAGGLELEGAGEADYAGAGKGGG